MSSARDDVLAEAGKVVQAWRTERQFIPEALEDAIISMMRSIERMNSTAHARASDKDTSRQGPSALQMTRGRQLVLRAFETHATQEMTDYELVNMLQGVMSASGVRSRRCELVRMGHLKDSGRTTRWVTINRERLQLARAQTVWTTT